MVSPQTDSIFCSVPVSWCTIPLSGLVWVTAPRPEDAGQHTPPLPRYLPVRCPGAFRGLVSLCRRVLLLCMAREEERGQESDGREVGENKTKDKILVLTFIAARKDKLEGKGVEKKRRDKVRGGGMAGNRRGRRRCSLVRGAGWCALQLFITSIIL